MKREIKFRGRNNGVWEYGNLIIADNGSPYIFPPEILETDGHHLRQGDDAPHWVDPATVGQYTGLKDRNGREIYEGDILLFAEELKSIVEFRHGMFGYEFCGNFIGYGGNYHFDFNPSDKDSNHEVIGNIYDNPDLIKKVE